MPPVKGATVSVGMPDRLDDKGRFTRTGIAACVGLACTIWRYEDSERNAEASVTADRVPLRGFRTRAGQTFGVGSDAGYLCPAALGALSPAGRLPSGCAGRLWSGVAPRVSDQAGAGAVSEAVAAGGGRDAPLPCHLTEPLAHASAAFGQMRRAAPPAREDGFSRTMSLNRYVYPAVRTVRTNCMSPGRWPPWLLVAFLPCSVRTNG